MAWTPEEIRSLRKRLGWSHSDLARRLGVGKDAVQEWEKGTLSPCRESQQDLHAIHYLMRNCSLEMSVRAVADALLEQNGLEQITSSQISEQID